MTLQIDHIALANHLNRDRALDQQALSQPADEGDGPKAVNTDRPVNTDRQATREDKKEARESKRDEKQRNSLFDGDGEDISIFAPLRSQQFKNETQTFKPVEGVIRKPVPSINANGKVDPAGCLQPTDFRQYLADCYFISTLHAVADRHPGLLESMVTKNSDGTYTVDFSVRVLLLSRLLGDVNHKEIVDASFPSQTVVSNVDDHLLVKIIEKAYARWQGSYNELEWGIPYFSLTHITGARSTFIFVHSKREEALYRQIELGIKRGYPMVAGTLDLLEYDGLAELIEKRAQAVNEKRVANGKDPIPTSVDDEDFDPKGILATALFNRASATEELTDQHCFSVVAVNQEEVDGEIQRTVTLRNPRKPADNQLITLTFADFQKQFFHLAINHAGNGTRRQTERKLRRDERQQTKIGAVE